ncbi:MAG TPA: DUF6600 domain-containing protein, partial [Thermoanaerobaculia bacterium]
MRKSHALILLLALIALPIEARNRHQSYISFEEGGAYVVQNDDGQEVAARVNLPLYPADEVRTGRRGRVEIRLSDGNIVALDRNTRVRFKSLRDAYDSEDEQTVIDLLYGEVIVHRLESDSSALRLDTQNASYISSRETIYDVVSEGSGDDVVSVFEGSLEVRTPRDTERVRAGEQVRVDGEGIYSENVVVRGGTTDFERWFLGRAQRYGQSSRYLNRRIGYAYYDLEPYGSWVYASDYGDWVWRPRVSVGWRPYYHGYWGHRQGCLTWISNDPWGWVPYHYGRWAWSPGYGWVWIPGTGYSPGWVYWAYGSSYVGWVPAGWYDCHRPYYDWLYRPYHNVGIDFGLGFHGRIRLTNIDHRAWTFVTPNTLISNRVDAAALTTDAIRSRLQRDGNLATITNAPARFHNDEIKDPTSAVRAIARRGAIGSGTGKEGSGSIVDATPFFRRDPELSTSIRERLVRSREPEAGAAKDAASGSLQRGGAAQDRGEAIDRGRLAAPARSGSGAVDRSRLGSPDRDGAVERKPTGPPDRGDAVDRSRLGSPDRNGNVSVDRVRDDAPAKEPNEPRGIVRERPSEPAPKSVDRPAPRRDDASPPSRTRDDGWRDRLDRSRDDGEAKPVERAPRDEGSRWRDGGRVSRDPASDAEPPRARESSGPRDVPRRIIDRIGGARVRPSERGDEAGAPRSRGKDSSGESSRSRGSNRSGGGSSVSRPSSPPPSTPSSSPPPAKSDGGST